MCAHRYPLGIQSFQFLREGHYTYVDKTHYLKSLVNDGKYYFLSRPRRFGKSLLLSTLHAYFEGQRDLFKGLSLYYSDVDWTPCPVLHFDFNSENYTDENGLRYILDAYLSDYESQYGIEEIDNSLSQRFRRLILKAYEQTGQKVAILVDEYDKPLLGIEENRELFEYNQAILKGFFGNLKTMDRYIRFAMLTGVARFNKVSIFSDLNNLYDISLSDEFADLCGWTEEELLDNFRYGIEKLAIKRKESPEKIVNMLRNYYDGYLFSEGGSRLYNPYSVMMALREKRITSYWFETGTPTFLARRVKRSGINPASLNGQLRNRKELMTVGFGTENPVGLMFQTGYLTIAAYDVDRDLYELRFPNAEVEEGFAECLAPLYIPEADNQESPFSIRKFRDDLYFGRPEQFMERFKTLLKEIPGEDHREATYRSMAYLLCTLSGTGPQAERRGYKGRTDLEVLTPGYVYIFEFKYNKSVTDAMSQIMDRDYAGRYAMDSRIIYLIAANFSDKKDNRGLTYEISVYS